MHRGGIAEEMKQLQKKYLDVLELHDWSVSSYTDDGRVELEKYSPAGEDFTMCVNIENFPEAVAEYAADFDIDDHIAMWIEAKRNGVSGVPATRELVHDAEDIDKMLQELASALSEARDKPQVISRDTEYGMFAKQISNGEERLIGRTVNTELLCRKRFEEKVRNREIMRDIDLSTAVVMKRETITYAGEWEAVGDAGC